MTPNATEDVPKEMIHSWYREMPGISFEDIVGMEAVRDQL